MDQDAVLRDVIAWATGDPDVRLLVVTGSYARGTNDDLSDLDIELYVSDPAALLDQPDWYERFGQVLVTEHLDNEGWHPTRLIYYVDGKIDFMIGPVAAAANASYNDAFRVLVDKDGLGEQLSTVATGRPSKEEFFRCINWFYAAAIMCAKELVRADPWPAKSREYELNERLLEMIEWTHRARHGWDTQIRHGGTAIFGWADEDIASEIEGCWSGLSLDATRGSLEVSKRLFERLAEEVGPSLRLDTSAIRPASAEVNRIIATME